MIKKTLANKGPFFGRGQVFKEENIYFNFNRPKVNEHCLLKPIIENDALIPYYNGVVLIR